MLKFFLAALLLANALIFAYHQGHLEGLLPSGREPERMNRQINADKIRLLPASPASPPPAPAPVSVLPEATAAPTAPAPAASAAAPVAMAAGTGDGASPAAATALAAAGSCIEIGNFSNAEARRFEAQLASLMPSVKSARLDRSETSSHMVLIPSQGDKEGAAKKAGELKGLGVTDYFILQDPPDSELRWGISLGVFRNEDAARAHLAQLAQKGVRSARLVEYRMPSKKLAFQLQGTGAQFKENMGKIKQAFPNQQARECA